MERPRRLLAAAAATLALAGCAEKAPTSLPTPTHSFSWDILTGVGLNCGPTPSDTRRLNNTYTANLFLCTDPDTNLPTRRVTITEIGADGTTIIANSIAALPPSEGRFEGTGYLYPPGECLIFDVRANQGKIIDAHVDACPPFTKGMRTQRSIPR